MITKGQTNLIMAFPTLYKLAFYSVHELKIFTRHSDAVIRTRIRKVSTRHAHSMDVNRLGEITSRKIYFGSLPVGPLITLPSFTLLEQGPPPATGITSFGCKPSRTSDPVNRSAGDIGSLKVRSTLSLVFLHVYFSING